MYADNNGGLCCPDFSLHGTNSKDLKASWRREELQKDEMEEIRKEHASWLLTNANIIVRSLDRFENWSWARVQKKSKWKVGLFKT